MAISVSFSELSARSRRRIAACWSERAFQQKLVEQRADLRAGHARIFRCRVPGGVRDLVPEGRFAPLGAVGGSGIQRERLRLPPPTAQSVMDQRVVCRLVHVSYEAPDRLPALAGSVVAPGQVCHQPVRSDSRGRGWLFSTHPNARGERK